MMFKKIKIGISSCLLGNNVRYDGGNKLDLYLKDTLGQVVEWVPVCPEVEAGLPVPREPMLLVADGPGTRLIAIETRKDCTNVLASWAQGKLRQLEREGIRGYVFKARSPSCGVHDAELFTSSGESIGVRAGLFADAVMRRFSSMPVEDEEGLRDPRTRERFLARISA